jgi:UDP-N-acetylglucosamine 2-epimerase (non-hydrolysing)
MVRKILAIFGTRPEAIKMAPLINELKKDFETKVCLTAQHREMLDQVTKLFELTPDYDLDIMKKDQNLFDLTSNLLINLRGVLEAEMPNLILVHGDTTTTMAASMSAFYLRIPIGHIEAGLRTNQKYSPFPEEINRQLTSKLATYHFAPTESAKLNLINENIEPNNIFVTGNTVIDALFSVLEKARDIDYPNELLDKVPSLSHQKNQKKIILVTGHRRENFGLGFRNICSALAKVAKKYPDIELIYPVHLNPNVINPVKKYLSGIKNIHLVEPLDYLPFLKLLDDSFLVLTDSGGIQEEAPSLGKPVLLMRDATERPEAVKAGTVVIVGTESDSIYTWVDKLISNDDLYDKMSIAHNPYGDGYASKKIVKILKESKF